MKAVIALSGGMDSAALLGFAKAQGMEVVRALHFQYGSKHNQYEYGAAAAVAQHYGVPLQVVNLGELFGNLGSHSNLLLPEGDIPEGHYEAETMTQTVVHGRNMVFASILGACAWANSADIVYLGVHSGDHAIYPDCRPEFVYAMSDAVLYGTDEKVHLDAPFLDWNKTKIIEWGLQADVPFQYTRTCYKDQLISCGKCGSCQERLEAFANNGVEDPIKYESRELLPK